MFVCWWLSFRSPIPPNVCKQVLMFYCFCSLIQNDCLRSVFIFTLQNLCKCASINETNCLTLFYEYEYLRPLMCRFAIRCEQVVTLFVCSVCHVVRFPLHFIEGRNIHHAQCCEWRRIAGKKVKKKLISFIFKMWFATCLL